MLTYIHICFGCFCRFILATKFRKKMAMAVFQNNLFNKSLPQGENIYESFSSACGTCLTKGLIMMCFEKYCYTHIYKLTYHRDR